MRGNTCRLALASQPACKADAERLCRFDSCSSRCEEMGVSSNGKTAGLHPANEGSIPSTVHWFDE